jgi:hypothetical protein
MICSMQSQLPPSVQAPRLDARSLVAAGLCVLALFFDVLGWVLAIAGILLLRRAAFSRTAKWLLAAIAIAPKILFVGARSLNAQGGLSFPIEPRNLATSSSLWAWCILLAAFGAFLIFLPRRSPQAPDAPVQPRPPRSFLLSLGLVAIAVAVVLLLGLTEGFHRIDDAGQGRWALRHAARGNVAIFTGSDLASIDAAETYGSRSGRRYAVRVALADGRSFSVTTKSAAALEELRKFATTANLPSGKVSIVRRNGDRWTSGASGFTLKDCVGRYELADESSRSRSTFEFWLDGGRLAGKETVADPEGRHVRVLRNTKVSDNGDVEFQPATYVEASQRDKGTVSFSFRWSPQGETGRFVKNGLEVGLQKYRKQ